MAVCEVESFSQKLINALQNASTETAAHDGITTAEVVETEVTLAEVVVATTTDGVMADVVEAVNPVVAADGG